MGSERCSGAGEWVKLPGGGGGEQQGECPVCGEFFTLRVIAGQARIPWHRSAPPARISGDYSWISGEHGAVSPDGKPGTKGRAG
jgi:hypothetical protein